MLRMRCHRAARRSRSCLVAVLVVLALGSSSSLARADPSFALAWRERSDAAACVTERALRNVVEEKLGRDPFVDRERADVVIEGEEVSSGARLRARVRERRRDGVVLGSREIDAETCPRLIRATGIVVALFVKASEDRGREEEEERGGPSGEGVADRDGRTEERAQAERGSPREDRAHAERPAPVTPPSASMPPPPHASAPRVATRRPFDLSLGLGGAAAVGLLPSASAAVRGVARLERAGSRWSFEWSAGYSLPQSFGSRAVRGTVSAVDQQVRACVALKQELAIRVDACGGAFWGAVVPRTVGLAERNDTWRPLAGPVAALAVQLRDGARAGRLELGMTAPVVGRTLYFQSAEAEPERLYSTGTVIVFFGASGLLSFL